MNEINIDNEFQLVTGENMPNHITSLRGQSKFVRPVQHPMFRTKQSAYRFAGWLLMLSETLPDEDAPHSFEEIDSAIREW